MFRTRFAMMFVVGAAFYSVHSAGVLAEDAPAKTAPASQAVELALGGYCPACYLLDRKAVLGDPKITSTFRGEVYYHTTPERRAAFDRNPVKYLPMLGGLCTAALGGPYGTRLEPDPRVFAIEDGKLYMFSSTRAMRVYLRDPSYYIDRARQRFEVPEFQGYCPVSYVAHGKAAKGAVGFRAVYHEKVYYLADADALKLFNQDPEKYLPQYEGYCPMAMAKLKKVAGDPLLFEVAEGKVYLFADEVARSRFRKGNSDIIEKADAAWELYHKQPE